MSPRIFESPLIVITGAAGCIGSCVVRYLNDLGHENLLLVDDFKTSEKWKNLATKKYVDFISKYELMPWLIGYEGDVQAIIHLGACSDTMEKNGDYLMENNYRYSIDLADFALDNDVRFIYASSAATYGDGSLGFRDSHDEIEGLRPLNLYGFSKHMFDLWVKRQGVLDSVVALKYFNVFGPNENHKAHMSSMVYKMVPIIQKEGVVKLFSSSDPQRFKDGEQLRDFIYVKDAVRMTCGFLHNKLSGIYNIGSGIPTSWNTLAKALFASLNIKEKIHYIPMMDDLKKQYQNYTCADMTKYREDVGLLSDQPTCEYSIESAVEDYVQNYLLRDERW